MLPLTNKQIHVAKATESSPKFTQSSERPFSRSGSSRSCVRIPSKRSILSERENVRRAAKILGIADQIGTHAGGFSNSQTNRAKSEKCKRDWPLVNLSGSETSVIPVEQLTMPAEAEDFQASLNRSIPSELIQTIKSPAFSCNCEGKTTSSVSTSDNTKDTRGTALQRIKPRLKSSCEETVTTYSTENRPLPDRPTLAVDPARGSPLARSLYFPDRESILVFGGFDPHKEYDRLGNTGNSIYRYKPNENTWEFVGEMPEARHHHAVAYVKGRVYVAGGADPRKRKVGGKCIALDTVWSYDPATREWFHEPRMLNARKDFGLVVSHGKMYAIGGQDKDGTPLNTVEAFDPSDSSWREMQAMYTARAGLASVSYRDLIWIGGGIGRSTREQFSKDVECYDPAKNLWLRATPLKSPRCFGSFCTISDRLYAIGGASPGGNSVDTQSTSTIDLWDVNCCLWKEQADMSVARHGHGCGSIGDRLMIIGGVTTEFMRTLDSVECYCPDIGKWMKGISAFPRAISGHGVVSLPPWEVSTVSSKLSVKK